MATRKETEYRNCSEKFLVNSFDYQKQYFHLYAKRLSEFTALLQPCIKKKWGDNFPIKKVCDLREDQQGNVIIIGTMYKHQAHKPSILREISEENQLAPQPPREHYADVEDKLLLEDELQRVRLVGKVDTRFMATGVVCAALGSIEEDGRFDVEELLFYESGPQFPLPQGNGDKCIAFVSGIDCLNAEEHNDSLNLFQHWLAGNLPIFNSKEQPVRLIVVGNSVRSGAENRPIPLNRDANYAIDCVLDEWLAAWSCTIPVDVMPGPHDPANRLLPQQPFHVCAFPKASRNESLRSVPNPYSCSVNNVVITGCSGQNISDLLRCTFIETALDALRSTLIWGHIAPTAPDTLGCYPYLDSDPFILKECPHIYFTGNCSSFATELHEGSDKQRTRLICVPSFSVTKCIAVVNLESLECRQICFAA